MLSHFQGLIESSACRRILGAFLSALAFDAEEGGVFFRNVGGPHGVTTQKTELATVITVTLSKPIAQTSSSFQSLAAASVCFC
jgi:hypothetical protein